VVLSLKKQHRGDFIFTSPLHSDGDSTTENYFRMHTIP